MYSSDEIVEPYSIDFKEKIGFLNPKLIGIYIHLLQRALSDFDQKTVNRAIFENLVDNLVSLIDRFLLLSDVPESDRVRFLKRNKDNISIVLQDTIRASQVALNRIDNDKNELLRILDYPKGEWQLKNVAWSGSDRHKQGHEALILTFSDSANEENEKKLVYKPTPLELSALLFGDLSILYGYFSADFKFPDKSLFSSFQSDFLDIKEAKSIYKILPRHDSSYEENSIKNFYGYTEFLSSMNQFYGKSSELELIKNNILRISLVNINIISDEEMVQDYFEKNKYAKMVILKNREKVFIFFRKKKYRPFSFKVGVKWL